MIWLLFSSLFADPILSTAVLKHELKKTEIKMPDGRRISWNFSDAKFPHLVQYFNQKSELISEKSDKDANGIFEVSTQINPQTHITEKSFDDDQDGIYERIERMDLNQDPIVITELRLNSKSKKFEIFSERKVPREKGFFEAALCNTDPNSNPIFESVNAFKPLLGALSTQTEEGDYVITNFGPRIHKNCLKKWGSDFPETARAAYRNGINCLSAIDGPGSRENLTKIASLLQNNENRMTFYCGKNRYESTLGWAPHIIAEAKVPGDKGFPAISFNPEKKRSKAELEDTILHETLHNCGYVHDENQIEYMYACPKCCENKPMDKASGACRICGGNFTSTKSSAYLSALADYKFSEAAVSIAKVCLAGLAEPGPGCAQAFLYSIQFTKEYEKLYSELYLQLQSQGLLNNAEATLYPPKKPAKDVSPETAALANALTLGSEAKSLEAIEAIAAAADRVSRKSSSDLVRTIMAEYINDEWYKVHQKAKADPKNIEIEKQDDYLWNISKKFKN